MCSGLTNVTVLPAVANGPPTKKKGTLPWLPSTYTLPVSAIQQVSSIAECA